jgi:DNA-binding NarL/FixJ family response regulator
MTIRLVVADDQELVRAGLCALLDSADDLEVVGEARNGAEAVELARSRRADLVLMDIRMPIMDGLEATRRIASDERLAGVRILILTTFEVDEYVAQALRAGASGFLVKDVKPQGLLDAVRTVVAGDALLSPGATRALITRFLSQPEAVADSAGRLDVVSGREREVLGHIASGLSNEEIAEQLVLSPLTVKTHVSRILAKTGARDRAQLVALAYETGLIRPGQTATGSNND